MGLSLRTVAQEFNVRKSTVSEIFRNKEKIVQYYASSENKLKNRKTLKLSAHPQMEKALFTWFLQERVKGMNIYVIVLNV